MQSMQKQGLEILKKSFLKSPTTTIIRRFIILRIVPSFKKEPKKLVVVLATFILVIKADKKVVL